MSLENEKYERILKILRKHKSELKEIETIEENVINRIRKNQNKHLSFQDITDVLFGWIYIVWIRRSLITASVFLVIFFVYQQTLILKGVNSISKQGIANGEGTYSRSEEDLGKQLMMYRITGRTFSSGDIKISEKQLKEVLDSYNELQNKYSGLIKIIEEDSVLREYIGRKLNESKTQSKKTNL